MERVMIGDTGEVLIGRGLPQPVLPVRPSRRRVVVFTQPGAADVARRVAEALAEVPAPVRVLPDREEAKSLQVAGEAYQWLANLQIGRHDTIVGVGGGAVTDLSGFVAATWLRGIESVLIPTTLLGAVDAAIGGKTGINVLGKNLVGAFWNPSRVIVDLEVLEQLSPQLRREGLAEALKAGLVGDPDLVATFEAHGEEAPLKVVVARAVAVKASVVGEDFRESGRRAVLNFGHTIGHAVEKVTGMPHGHAVAVGMVGAAAISARRYGFDQEWLTNLIFSLGLPVAAAGTSSEPLRRLIGLDKKRSEEGIRMVLLRAVGDPVVEPVSEEDINTGLLAIGCA